MTSPRRGEVWLVDLGMAAKVRPALVIRVPADDTDRALVTIRRLAAGGQNDHRDCLENLLRRYHGRQRSQWHREAPLAGERER